MRLLFVPVFNYPNNLNADSIYLISSDWCSHIVEHNPNMTIIRLLPEQGRENMQKFQYNYKPVHERVINYFIPMYSKFTVEELNIPLDTLRRFHPKIGDIPVDAIVSTSSIKSMMIKKFFTIYATSQIPIFNFELLIRGMGSREVANVNELDMLMQSMGAYCGYNLLESLKCKKTMIESARRFIAPGILKEAIRNSAIVYSGYNAKETAPEKKKDVFTIIVRGRLTASKNVDKILELYNKFFAAGRKVKILLTTGDVRGSVPIVEDALRDNSEIEFLNVPTKEEANKIMKSAHAFVFWSTHELFAVSVWEMLGAGLIGVFKKAEWHEGLLPDGYPYVFDGVAEAYSMLKDIYDDYEGAQKKIEPFVKHVRETYPYEKTTKQAYDIIERKIKESDPKGRNWITDMFVENCDKAFYSIEDLKNIVAEHAEMGKGILFKDNYSRVESKVGHYEIMKAARTAGYTENPCKLELEFTKEVPSV